MCRSDVGAQEVGTGDEAFGGRRQCKRLWLAGLVCFSVCSKVCVHLQKPPNLHDSCCGGNCKCSDTEGSIYKSAEDSSRRVIVLTGLKFNLPFIQAATFFDVDPVAKYFAYRISETGLYDQSFEYLMRLPIEIICFVYFLTVLFGESNSTNAARMQDKIQQKLPKPSKAQNNNSKNTRKSKPFKHDACYQVLGSGCRICCSSGWDCFDFTSAVFSILTIVTSWIAGFFVPLYQTTHEDVVKECIASTNCFTFGRTFSNLLLSALTLTGLMNVVCVFKFTRFHAGMRVYTLLFYESWLTLRDFIPWFILLMFSQAWFISTMYSAAGTNQEMIHIGGALSVV